MENTNKERGRWGIIEIIKSTYKNDKNVIRTNNEELKEFTSEVRLRQVCSKPHSFCMCAGRSETEGNESHQKIKSCFFGNGTD